MFSIRLDINDVIEDVNAAGSEPKQEKSDNRVNQAGDVDQLLVKNHGCQEEYILGPLAQTHRLNQSFEHGINISYLGRLNSRPDYSMIIS